MRMGICTTDFAPRGMDELFVGIAGMGFSCMQFAFASIREAAFVETGEIEIPAAYPADLLRDITARARVHALPIVAINGTYNMAHPDAQVREEGARRFLKLIDAANAMEVPYITLCTGSRNRDSLWAHHPENTDDAAWDDMTAQMRAILPRAQEMGVTLLIETEAANTCRTAALARRLMDEMGSENLKIVLDPANLFLPGTAQPENVRAVLDDAFLHLGGDICLAHGKDIRAGAGIDFCAAGRGIVDFPYLFDKLRAADYAGDMVLHGIYDEEDMPRALDFMRAAADM
ncbi:MAG: sugar phosphate isomerase/epimerase family protein [Christensenellales bacterium]|jgi:sugar phosphate isomerase/epimerase